MKAKISLQEELGKKLDAMGVHTNGPVLQPSDLDRFTSAHLTVIRSTFHLCRQVLTYVAETRDVLKPEPNQISFS